MIVLSRGAQAFPPPARRRLHLLNAHTGEIFDGPYRDDFGPITAAMAELSIFLRDFHSETIVDMDVGVIDFLASVMDAVGVESAVILSAYRSPATNEMLARTTFGVAENSQHMYGRALDVNFGTKLNDAMQAARKMQRGGVGWYPSSEFIHIDTGPIRDWEMDESGLGSLLLNGRHWHFDRHGYLAENVPAGKLFPSLQASGRPLPGIENSGRPLPGFETYGHPYK